MNTFAVIFLCFQACLVQNVFSQCTSRAAVSAEPGLLGPAGLAGPYGLGAYDGLAGYAGPYFSPASAAYAPAATTIGASPFGYGGCADLAYPAAISRAVPYGAGPAYGGSGEGNVAVAGELPVAGTTAVAGQVPIMGAVNFGGAVPAAGAVSISGQCACGCGAPY